jgi:hypothetical protein
VFSEVRYEIPKDHSLGDALGIIKREPYLATSLARKARR